MPHPAFEKTSHRPWPVPDSPWKWRQSWCDLLFTHWPVDVNLLRSLVPEPLTIQEFNGTTWLGIVPLRMQGVMRRPLPDLPWISSFPEINVRLYVNYEDKPGVWFLSLDAANFLAVWAARHLFYLPYYNASMNISQNGRFYHFSSQRKTKGGTADFDATYEPVSKPYQTKAGSLEHWLTERYCLYAESSKGELYRCEVHHLPWPLQKAEGEIYTNTLLDAFAFSLPDISPLLHFSSRLDVVVWPPERLKI